ncbi:T9SS type A sorting domain-containing protein [Crocinitomix catalasitica]|nr:T9SS type A sorting domain-containing protein [Crocinitomix catalasitica]
MKKMIFITALSLGLSNSVTVLAQCSGCTITISGIETLPQVVMAGTTLCITPTGNLQGDLGIFGGTVCNEGIISSFSIAQNGGTFNNYGNIDGVDFAIHSGNFENYGSTILTDFGISGVDLTITNTGTFSCTDFAISKTTGGADPIFNNNGTINVFDMGIGINTTFNNNGDLIVSNNYANSPTASFYNYGYMSVGYDFANDGNFHTECVVTVGNDWANDGVMTGPAAGSCGGFSVGSIAANTSDFAVDDSYLDMCVGGSSGFDVNVGTLGTNVTTCSCSSICVSVATIESKHELIKFKVYPNPFSEYAIIDLGSEVGSYRLGVFNLQGQLVKEIHGNQTKEIKINREDLPGGMYFFQLTLNGSVQGVGRMSIL